ncbi:MAG TPA: PQQ-binding-like beta-propeller repeat protein [Terracidiphilus sp.]
MGIFAIAPVLATVAALYAAAQGEGALQNGRQLNVRQMNGSQALADWSMAGQNLADTRSQPAEHRINPANVSRLSVKWIFTTANSVSATPAVVGDAVYFPDWAGNLYAVNRETGRQIWSASISSYDGFTGAVSRVTPTVYRDELIFGDNEELAGAHNGANLIAVDRSTGALRWITQIDSHPAAIVTGSAVVFDGVVYQGISSSEEGLADTPGYPCCTFRGSVVAVDAKTGRILWQTFAVPDNHGAPDAYSGGAIWQPPVVEPGRRLLYVGTGNNYSAPAAVLACRAAHPMDPNCTASNDHFDSVLAMDLRTGAVRWTRRLWGYDVWTVACIAPRAGVSCPSPAGPDYDLGGSGANLANGILGIGQKSGIYWALDAQDGAILWGTPVAPGGPFGGILWGTATDGRRIYVASADSNGDPYKLPSGQTAAWGSWSALDPLSGKILWQTPDPTQGAIDTGSVSVANGVLYAGSQSGGMYALDAANGKILWSFASGGSVMDGPAIADGVVYWASGYGHDGGTFNNKVYAFEVPRAR